MVIFIKVSALLQ